ncbi:MAG: alanine racemase [Clostridium sp.]|uniref:alanine racemase n=1 Tax=Clostridium sp. TaxID=1506 RepID=UPI003F3CAEB4
MEKNLRAVWAEIDLNKLENNMRRIKELAGDKEVIAVVKADAYGHGAVNVAPLFLKSGASKLAVAVIAEAMELRSAGIKAPIMILGYTPLDLYEELINNDIEQTVYDLDYAKELSERALKIDKKAKIHIAVDTGMGRIGFMPNETSVKEVIEICNLEGLEVCGLFTHFSTSDEEDKTYTEEQFKKLKDFDENLKENGIKISFKHASNSGAIIDLPDTYLDGVRAGIILYGYYPSNEVDKNRLKLEPAFTLKTTVAHVKTLEKDMYISYGRTFKTERKSIIATLPIGYADGYLRLLSGKVKVIINGKFAELVGRICMDQCMIDVTDIEGVKVGDEVILLGEDGNLKFNADDIAEAIGTINYEVLCMIRHRVPRIYIRDNKVCDVRNYL